MKKKILIIVISIISSLLYTSCITTRNQVEFIPRETALPGWTLVNQNFLTNTRDKEFPEFLKKSKNIVSVSISEYVFFSDADRRVDLIVVAYNDFLSALNSYSEILLSTEKEIIFLEEFSALSDGKYVSVHENLVIIAEPTIMDHSVIRNFQSAVIEMLPEEQRRVTIPVEARMFAGNRPNLLYLQRGLPHLLEINNVFIRHRENYRLLYRQFSSEEALLRAFATLSGVRADYTLGSSHDLTYLFKEDDDGKVVLIFYYKEWLLSVIDVDNMNNAISIATEIIIEAKNQGL